MMARAVMRLGGFATLAGLALLSIATARAEGPVNGVVLGDSQGEGVALASGLKNLARISVHIRGVKAIAQVNSAPVGSTAFLVLGSNDAECCLGGLDKSIDAIVHAAESRGIKLVWLGPPCVRKGWNFRVRELDQMLTRRFAGSGVTYVSMWDDKICSGVFHEPDGVHLTMKGYAYMWQKAATLAGFPVPAPTALAATASADDVAATATHAPAAVSPKHKPHVAHASKVARETRAKAPFVLSDRQGAGG